MNLHGFDPLVTPLTRGLSRRAALRRLGGGGLAAAALGAVGLQRRAAAQETALVAPAGWRTEHLEVEVTPVDPVTITRAGGGPPQRGDFFHVDAPIFAYGDVNGTEIGRYQCFGTWTHAADDTTATEQRLTTVQFRFPDGAIMGLINEGGTDARNQISDGAVQGGTGKYTAALGTFQQIITSGNVPGVGTPGAVTNPSPGTPAAGQTVVHTTLDLLLPAGS
jgi:hypothetical protein